MLKFLCGLICFGMCAGVLQAHDGHACSHTHCACGCGCEAPCDCGCLEGKTCTCNSGD